MSLFSIFSAFFFENQIITGEVRLTKKRFLFFSHIFCVGFVIFQA